MINFTELKPLIVDVPQSDGNFERIYRIGIVGDYFPFEPVSAKGISPRAALNSAQSTYSIIEGSIKGVYHIIIGNISRCNLSGPISIAETSGQMVQQGGLNFLVHSCLINSNRDDKLISNSSIRWRPLNVFCF